MPAAAVRALVFACVIMVLPQAGSGQDAARPFSLIPALDDALVDALGAQVNNPRFLGEPTSPCAYALVAPGYECDWTTGQIRPIGGVAQPGSRYKVSPCARIDPAEGYECDWATGEVRPIGAGQKEDPFAKTSRCAYAYLAPGYECDWKTGEIRPVGGADGASDAGPFGSPKTSPCAYALVAPGFECNWGSGVITGRGAMAAGESCLDCVTEPDANAAFFGRMLFNIAKTVLRRLAVDYLINRQSESDSASNPPSPAPEPKAPESPQPEPAPQPEPEPGPEPVEPAAPAPEPPAPPEDDGPDTDLPDGEEYELPATNDDDPLDNVA